MTTDKIKTVYDASLQRSEGWFQFRLARLTGSRVGSVWQRTAYKWPKSRKDLMSELLLEARTGEVKKLESNIHMQRGTRLEPVARDAAIFHIRKELGDSFDVEDVGSCYHMDRPWLAASPDGLTTDNCVLEIKCPTVNNHMKAFYDGMPQKHLAQIYAEMYTTERQGCYFVSYNEEVAEEYRIYIEYIERNPEMEEEFFNAVGLFADEFRNKLVKELKDIEETPRILGVKKLWGI